MKSPARRFRLGDVVLVIDDRMFNNRKGIIVERNDGYGIGFEDGCAWWFGASQLNLIKKADDELDAIAEDLLSLSEDDDNYDEEYEKLWNNIIKKTTKI